MIAPCIHTAALRPSGRGEFHCFSPTITQGQRLPTHPPPSSHAHSGPARAQRHAYPPPNAPQEKKAEGDTKARGGEGQARQSRFLSAAEAAIVELVLQQSTCRERHPKKSKRGKRDGGKKINKEPTTGLDTHFVPARDLVPHAAAAASAASFTASSRDAHALPALYQVRGGCHVRRRLVL